MELTQLEQQRVVKLQRLQDAGVDVYPHRVERTHTIDEALALYGTLEADGSTGIEATRVAVAGRLRSVRTMGKVTFAHIDDGTGAIQLFLRLQKLGDCLLFLK